MSAWRDYRTLVRRNPFALATLVIAAVTILAVLLAAVGWLGTGTMAAAQELRAGKAVIGGLVQAIVRELIRLTWPAVALLAAMAALVLPTFGRGAAWLANRTRKVKVGEVELEFSPEAAKQLAQTTDEAFAAFRVSADREFRRQVVALDIRPLLEATLNRAEARLPGNQAITDVNTARCTLYVKDILFEDRLYQLTDYYPWDGKPSVGRTFSSRFGIVGRAWRTERHLGEGDVRTDRDSLMRDWGMTREEASRLTRQRPAYLCAILRAPAADGGDAPDGLPVALLFADADAQDAFGTEPDVIALAGRIADAALKSGLRAKLKVLRDEINKYSAAIHP